MNSKIILYIGFCVRQCFLQIFLLEASLVDHILMHVIKSGWSGVILFISPFQILYDSDYAPKLNKLFFHLGMKNTFDPILLL